MASLNDIPPELLLNNAKEQFLNWLSTIPITNYNKKELASKWQKLNNIRFSKEDYIYIGLIDNE